MKNKLRFVVDTNVFVSFLLFPNSVPGRIIFEIEKKGSFLVSKDTIAELSEVFSRAKFDKYISYEKRYLFLHDLIQKGIFIPIDQRINICRDPKDNKFLELSVCGQADYIITGDDDLSAILAG